MTMNIRVFLALMTLVSALTYPSEGAVAQEPDIDIAGSYRRSFEYERAEAYQDAIRALAPVYEAYPNAYTVNLRMGWLFYLNGNYNNAAAHYGVARSAAPFALEPKLGQLLPLLAQGRWNEAETVAYEVVSVDHYNYYGNMRLIVALRMQEKFEPAYQIALKMATAYPTDLTFLEELARLNQARGDTEEATRLFTDLLILDPENQAAREYLGR
jgi:tetratricopeptide (TPR) repeat protein